MTVYTYTGWGERGSRFLADLLRFLDNAGIITVIPAANGDYYIETARGDVLRVGYSDTDSQVIAEVEELVDGELLELLGRVRAIEPENGAGMDRVEGRRILEDTADIAQFIRDLVANDNGALELVKIFASSYGGSGSGFADWVLDQIKANEFLSPQNADRPRVIVDATLPELKRDDQVIRTEDGQYVFRYEDALDQIAEFETAGVNNIITAVNPSDNGLALIAEMAHQGNLTLDQIRAITSDVIDDNDWGSAADYLRTQVDLDDDHRVGALNTAAIRAESATALLRFDDQVTYRDPQGGRRDHTDMMTIADYHPVIVDAHAAVDRGEAAQDEPHLGKTTESAVISASKRASNLPLAGVSPTDVEMVQIFVATADGAPLTHLDTARNAVAKEFGNGDYHITTTGIENIGPEHFADGNLKEAAVWLRFGAETVLPVYEELEAKF